MVIGVPCMPLRIFVVDIEAEAFSRGVDYMVEKKRREEFVYSCASSSLSAQK